MGDLSEKGIAQAYGTMVNYRYVLADIEKNHEPSPPRAKWWRARR